MILTVITFVIALSLILLAGIVSKFAMWRRGLESEARRRLQRLMRINLSLLGIVGLIIGGAMIVLERDIPVVVAAYLIFVPLILLMLYYGSQGYIREKRM